MTGALCSALLLPGWTGTQAATPPAGQSRGHAGSGFTLSVPPGWKVDGTYAYRSFGPGHPIHGVLFHIPPKLAHGTNLSPDLTGISVESVPGPGRCEASRFLPSPVKQRALVENGTTYSVAEGHDAGAGNFYDEIVYAVVGSAPCIAVRYFIHSTNIANYDPGTVRAFDRPALIAEFDRIRRTLVLRPRAPAPAAPR